MMLVFLTNMSIPMQVLYLMLDILSSKMIRPIIFLSLLQQASKLPFGSTPAKCQYGWTIYKRYPKQAMDFFYRASKEGDLNGMVSYAIGLEIGLLGTPKIDEAVRLYYQSMKNGNLYGQAHFARCLKNGFGITINIKESQRLLQEASQMGNSYAKLLLKSNQTA